jgi:hypothetical protein
MYTFSFILVACLIIAAAISIFTASLALTIVVWLMQDGLSFEDFADTFKVCLTYNGIIVGAEVLTFIFKFVAIGFLGSFGTFLAMLACLAASIFSIRLLMSWGGFGVYSALITSGLAGMVQWFILAGSLGLLMGILS